MPSNLAAVSLSPLNRSIAPSVVLATKGNPEAAIIQFQKALAIDSTLGEAYFDLGGALLGTGKTDAAIQAFRQALSLAPDWAEAHYQLGRALLAVNRPAEARLEFQATLKNDPNHSGARQGLEAFR